MVEWLNLTDVARQGRLDPVIGREREIERIIQMLLRRIRRHPLLVGAPGVGKTAIIEGLAQRIAQGAVPASLRDAQIYAIDLGLALAQARVRGEATSIEALFVEAMTGLRPRVAESGSEAPAHPSVETLVFVDELHLLSTTARDGVAGMVNLLRLAQSQARCAIISETTPEHYDCYRAQAAELDALFQPILVVEPSVEEASAILRGIAERFEAFHGVAFDDETLRTAAALAKRHLPQRALPDSAVDLLDEAAGRVRGRAAGVADPDNSETGAKRPVVTPADVAAVLALWTGLTPGQIATGQ
jgi:ATP-dependent Clp protease ATP-binding subunit ClpA